MSHEDWTPKVTNMIYRSVSVIRMSESFSFRQHGKNLLSLVFLCITAIDLLTLYPFH